jgi:subfamily B ATP-binding cassette protein MsbA
LIGYSLGKDKKSSRRDADKRDEGRRRSKVLSSNDIAIIRRVLGYAASFKLRIIGALLVGMLASALTAINLVALIPILSIMFEDPATYDQKVAIAREKLALVEDEMIGEGSLIRRTQLKVEQFKVQVEIQWKDWIRRKQDDAIYLMALFLVLAQVLKNGLEFLSKYTLQKSFYYAVLRIRTDLYARCLQLDLQQFTRYTSGELISRLNNDIRAVRNVFTTMVGDIVLAPFTIFSLLGVLFLLNWKMTLIVLVGLPLIVLPIAAVGKLLRGMGRKDEEEDARILAYTQETLIGMPVVKSFGTEERETIKFKQLSREMAKRQVRREKMRLYGDPAVEILASIAMAGVICLGAYLVLKSSSASMSPAAFLIYLGILTRFYPPIKRMSGTYVKLQKALANAERIFEVIDTNPLIVDAPDAIELPPFEKEIRFEHVTFSYGADRRPALIDFDLVIPKGKKIAIVGETGAGKSTVIRLLPRLYDPNSGRLLIDGHDLRQVTKASLRRQLAVVTQESILFNDTIYNNIAYGRPSASREEVLRAAEDALVMEFANELPQGIDTRIGERGGQLSGGQKQRITIARALVTNAPILILDEATSALDNVSEALVQKAIEHAMADHTVIVIAHRLSTIRRADEILVMDAGHIVERGTHDELMAQGGTYHDLVTRPHQTDEDPAPLRKLPPIASQ